ncbi:MAG: twin-arginine translocation signal domain-containing protein [Planctomycetales bacterium]|nr:twin-arginine translocation signal domain-containing protein [Planctomycetales bacterium]
MNILRDNRRDFLQRAAAFGGMLATGAALGTKSLADEPRRPRVAAIFTVLRFRSHAYNILENFFRPYLFRGELVEPGVEVVSMYADQFPADDMARDVSRRFQVPLYDSIEAALCGGGRELDVDAVLLIGEHGDYPYNKLGQHLYPRKQFFDQIAAVVRRANRPVPLFNDKHLSYRWDWAKEIYDTARELKMPLLAGSSVPLAERRPMLELPAGAEIEQSVSLHGGGLESYDFHAFEVLQSMIERRQGSETGITRVELLTDDRLRAAQAESDWPHDLIAAARQAEQQHDEPRQRRPSTGVFAAPAKPESPNRKITATHAIRLTYRDGLRALVMKDGSSSDRWNFACRVRGEREPRACMFFNGPWSNRCLFKALSHAIQHHFRTGQPPYPVERTLLASGVLDAAMHSHDEGGRAIDTPHLAFAYESRDFSAFRENGASWRKLTRDTPQPADFSPGNG